MQDFYLGSLLWTLVALSCKAIASTCWRNTTCSGPDVTSFPGQWESNIFAPASRTVSPKHVASLEDLKFSAYSSRVILNGNGSGVVFDFGIEVGGVLSVQYAATGSGSLGLAFTEASTWIGEWSDASNGKFAGRDGALYSNFSASGNNTYVMPDTKLRGGFRYLTAFLVTEQNATVSITDISLEIGFQPTWSNLRAYQGYFHCNDELLNRIWYAGAYTLQTNAVPVNTGRWVPMLANGWANNGTLGPGDTIIVDGAKRDRAVWPGDMGIAVPSSFVSIGDLDSVKNALQVMYNYQNADGSFPEAGPPLLQQNSDTYHMWTMIGTYNYMLYTDDSSFIQQNWERYLKAMSYIYGKVGTSGLLNQTGTRDWARWQTGFNNTEANIILYRTLQTGSELATWLNDTTNVAETWQARAEALKSAINKYCFDTSYGAFKDNATSTTLHPQDANSMSLLFGIVNANTSTASSISTRLTDNWTPIGAVAPELPENISPFISSFEIQGHLTIDRADRALDLIRRSWGWYANHPNGTGSTVIEGYLANGTFGYRSSRGYGYDASYVSHSHGWSSGPTSALTEYIVGLSVTSPAGKTWSLRPQFGDLERAEAGFTTNLGKFWAKWETKESGEYQVGFGAPAGTSGVVSLPVLEAGKIPIVLVNGVAAGNGSLALSSGRVTLDVGSGNYTVQVTQ
ncbi:glycoside hydrolase family 78 protein [Lophiostoma macrostomum CBS 122681]|uniref:Glycoside hydrolase family 78 protein n=1 Tax=Lophiostoma macrostomum CBS 122681 TaxID=1314788 RepID=A0A6A6SSD6_9PLEO|nr:glycoside hydrolase family 78 protein [Lophiostoma macrostomum CBS 122681]